MVRALALVAALVAGGAALAAAEGKFSKAVTDAVDKTMAGAGCSGGELVSMGDGILMVDNASCGDGTFDVEINRNDDYKIVRKITQ